MGRKNPCNTDPVYLEPMASLTLSIDDALLRRAREAALRENTSVNALVRDFLGRYVDARSRRLAALAQFEAVAEGSASSSSAPWTRESLHEGR
jgi:predicted transcriptional regulator